MNAYRPQQLQQPKRPQHPAFPEASFNPMDWEFDEEDSRDVGAFPSDFCPTSPQLMVPCTAGGDASAAHSDPVDGIPLHHSNPHNSSFPQVLSPSAPLEQYLPGPDLVPSHYRSSQAPQVPHHRVIQQLDDELAGIYPGPPVVSQYSSPVKLDQEDFSHLHHPAPAYLPPESFLLSPLSVHENPFPTEAPINPQPASAEEAIIKLEDSDFTERDEEGSYLLSPLRATPEALLVPPALTDCCMPYGRGGGTDCKQAQLGQSGLAHPPMVPEDPLDEHDDDTDHDKMAPYAVLIHRALMSAPNHKMVLSQIYEYFREKIPRFRKVKGRGWMNSIRHNLSMNGAFLKEDRPPEDPGKGFIWVLSEEAAREGVKSTTRYRKSPPSSKRRATEEFFHRGNGVRKRRKSLRKWTSTKSCSRPRSRSTTSLAEHSQHEIELQQSSTSTDSSPCPDDLPSPQTPVHIPVLVKHLGLPMDGGSIYSTDKILPPFDSRCPHGLDYASCYESLAHAAANSRAIYNNGGGALPLLCDEGWRICEVGDHFSEEFTLVTQERRRA